MLNIRFTLKIFMLAACTLAFCVVAQAQATRTWVSGVGDDVNPCSRTAPCKTFAGAISKTATGGEIDVLDPGGYGTLTVTKAITVDGGSGSGWGSTLASSVNGFVINITTNLTTDKVILRNLSINGAGTTLGVDGIRFLDGAELTVENVHIFNFSDNGIDINQVQTCNVYLKNVKMTNIGNAGIRSTTTTGTVAGTFENLQLDGIGNVNTDHGVHAVNNTTVTIRNCVAARVAGAGFRAEGTSILLVDNSMAFSNNVGFEGTAGGQIRLNSSNVFHNNTGIAGTVNSYGNNRFSGNGSNGTPVAPPPGVIIQ